VQQYIMESAKQQIKELRTKAWNLLNKLNPPMFNDTWEELCEASTFVPDSSRPDNDYSRDTTEEEQIAYWTKAISYLTDACKKKAREEDEAVGRYRQYINSDGTCRAHDRNYCAQCRRSAEGRGHPDEWM
jgi:hypothetical protein